MSLVKEMMVCPPSLVCYAKIDKAVYLEEFAEYTSAQERIALGKKSRKVEAQKRRDEMSEMIVDA
jgi:hypothetical protein